MTVDNAQTGGTGEALDAYRKGPGGGPACMICGHRYNRHEDSLACLIAALRAIQAQLGRS